MDTCKKCGKRLIDSEFWDGDFSKLCMDCWEEKVYEEESSEEIGKDDGEVGENSKVN